MPLMKQGPLAGLYMPDYNGGSIVNMLSSIIHAKGGQSPHPELSCLPAEKIRSYRKVIYLVVDGLGIDQLERFRSQNPNTSFLGKHPYQSISSVFPATTASAVTTFATGTTPAEHGILSWYLFLPDLGLISTILLCTTRMGQPLAEPDFPLAEYLDVPSYLSSVPVAKETMTYDYIVDSQYSMMNPIWQKRTSYKILLEMEDTIATFIGDPEMEVGYAYWPHYDSYCHAYGCAALETEKHLLEIDQSLGRLAEKIQGTDTLLLVLADHGLIDAPLNRRIDLSAIPGLYDCMTILPSGDAREVSCFIRPAYVDRFLDIVHTHLDDACICISGEELIKCGAYGPGVAHDALSKRVGDYVLISRDDHAFSYPIGKTQAEFNVGNHGGMSAGEMRIPLFIING